MINDNLDVFIFSSLDRFIVTWKCHETDGHLSYSDGPQPNKYTRKKLNKK